ncbi:MAG: ArnT family glycosyltransferase [Myxococcaceae bacterium]
MTRRDGITAVVLFVATFALMAATERAIGIPRDESVYFEAGERYAAWFADFAHRPHQASSRQDIARAFSYNAEHPVLLKNLFGLSHALFHNALKAMRPISAFRVPAWLIAATLPSLIYLLGVWTLGRIAGLFGALAFFAIPRHFFHGHIAAFDLPITAFWLATVLAFLRAQHERRWAYACGIAFGLALATKHNAFFLPLVLAPLAVARAYRRSAPFPEGRRALFHLVLSLAGTLAAWGVMWLSQGIERFVQSVQPLSPPVAALLLGVAATAFFHQRLAVAAPAAAETLLPLWAMAVIGPLVLYVHWPLLWHAPVQGIAAWLSFHARHEHYPWMYLGQLLREPPFPLAYVLVVTVLTVPASLSLPMALGTLAPIFQSLRMRRWPSFDMAVILANAAASILIISHPNVPHFGGVKHWFPSMPFLCLLAGASVARAIDSLPWPRRASIPLAFGLLLAPAAIATARVHPYGTAAYSEWAGGVPGAASLGMQRQFWSSHVTGVLPWINSQASKGARVWLHEVTSLAFRDYQENQMLRSDLVPVWSPDQADIVAYQYHQEFREHEYQTWEAFGTDRPAFGLYVDETPQVVVYVRRKP